jgi:hypothetical protein
MAVVRLRGVYKRFGNVKLIDIVFLDIEDG